MNRQHTKHTASLLSFTHIADGSQFLSCVAFFQQSPGVFTRIGPVVVHCEFSAHEVGSDRKQTGHEMFTPFHIFQMLAAFCFTFESCGLAESNKYQENSNYWMLQFILTVSKQKIFGITLNVILKKRGKSERLQCNPTGQLSRPKWMSLSLPLMGSDCQHYEKDPYRDVYLTSRRSLALKSHRRWGVAGRKKCECEWELEEARHGREEKLPVQ